MTDRKNPIPELERLLSEQRDTLRRGTLGQLDPATAQLEQLLGELESEGVGQGRDDLSRLRALADTNLSLLDAARQGVRSIRQRVAEATRLSSGSQTYDREGKRRSLGSGKPKQDRSY